MQFTIHTSDFEEIGYDGALAENIYNDSGVVESTSLFSLPGGQLNYTELAVGDLHVLEGKYAFDHDVSIIGKPDTDILEMQFTLAGHVGVEADYTSHQLVAPMSNNIFFISTESDGGRLDFYKNVDYRTFDIHIPLSFLTRYYGESRLIDRFIDSIVSGEDSSLLSESMPVSPVMSAVIRDIRHCTYKGLGRRIYLESKISELFALQLDMADNMMNIGSKGRLRLQAYDIGRIHEAAAYIRQNLAMPCTIIELAHKVGLNDNKLKKGFKEVFGMTIFGYLQQLRMQKARNYLLDTELSIEQISDLSGYGNSPAFSYAFKRYFGYPPTDLKK